jgi:hypothetical protein
MPKQPAIQQDPQAEGFTYKDGLFFNKKDQMMTPLPDGRFIPIPLEGLRDPKKVIANTKAKTSKFAEITQAREMDALTKGQSFLPEQYRGRGLEESGLPEYGFGSWLKENGAGLLKGASSLVSAIPIVGKIAAPILNLAGSALSGIQKHKSDQATADQTQVDIDEEQARLDKEAAGLAETNRITNKGLRQKNIVNQNQVSYAGTFEDGGDLSGGLINEQPVINEYSEKANSHSEGIGGIPVDAQGNPATVSNGSVVGLTEAGEVTWNGYVFSDKLKVNKK